MSKKQKLIDARAKASSAYHMIKDVEKALEEIGQVADCEIFAIKCHNCAEMMQQCFNVLNAEIEK